MEDLLHLLSVFSWHNILPNERVFLPTNHADIFLFLQVVAALTDRAPCRFKLQLYCQRIVTHFNWNTKTIHFGVFPEWNTFNLTMKISPSRPETTTISSGNEHIGRICILTTEVEFTLKFIHNRWEMLPIVWISSSSSQVITERFRRMSLLHSASQKHEIHSFPENNSH